MWISKENVDCIGTQDPQSQTPKGAQTSHRSLAFPKSFRLRTRADFQRIRRDKTRFWGDVLLIEHRLGRGPYPRLGITAPRKFGKAVQRNRFKRLVREAFRVCNHTIPPQIELNVHPKRDAPEPTLESVMRDIEVWLKQVAPDARAAKSPTEAGR